MPSLTNSRQNTRSFVNQLLSRLPYTYKILDQLSDLNPKYKDFQDLTTRKDDRIAQQSIVQMSDKDNFEKSNASIMVNKDYHRYMYANIDADKIRRLQQYRRMAAYAEVSDAIDEICDETIVKDKDGDIVKFNLEGKYADEVRKEVNKEWEKFIEVFNLEDRGWEYFRSFLIDGELFYENVISEQQPNYGILGVVQIPTELINPIYDNVQNSVIKGFLLKRAREQERQDRSPEELIVFDRNQVTYVHSGLWNEDRTMRIPYIENCRRAYKQLSLIEDSIVIYRLVRAPERLVFYVDVGNMPSSKIEQYMQKLSKQYWSRKTYDPTAKTTTNVYDPQSMLDSFWFAKKTGDVGTKVETLAGGQNLGQLEDLMYFVHKLYKSLKVPIGRLSSDNSFKDGAEITREELRFAKFIMRLQRQFAMALKASFIVHLKLRQLWDAHKLKESHLNLTFNLPTHFMQIRDQQLFDLKFTNYNNMGNNDMVSQSYAQRYYLEWDDAQMAENREWLRKDMELLWEIDQIRANGPDFREKMNAVEGAVGDMGSGGGGGGISMGAADAEVGGFQPDIPPEFGPAPVPPSEGGQPDQGGQPSQPSQPAQ